MVITSTFKFNFEKYSKFIHSFDYGRELATIFILFFLIQILYPNKREGGGDAENLIIEEFRINKLLFKN